MEIEIDKVTGRVWVAGKYGVSSLLTVEDITVAPFSAKAYALSGLPYKWFKGGIGRLGMEFCFAEGVLALVDFHTLPRLEDELDLSDADDIGQQLDNFERRETAFMKEEKAKADLLLEKQLGTEGIRYEYVTPAPSPTDFNLVYSYPWGEVSSLYRYGTRNRFEQRGAFVRVEYQGVRLKAQRAYARSGRGVGSPGLVALRARLAEKQH